MKFNKWNIAKLQFLKKIFPKGLFMTIRDSEIDHVKFWFDKNTDNGFILGFYETSLRDIINTHLKEGNCFFDLGAHWGYFTLIAAKKVGYKGKVCSFEPMPMNFNRLQTNVNKNHLQQVELFELAISNKNGSVHFSNSSDSFANTYLGTNKSDSLEVKTKSLDYLVFNESLPNPDFIKIDVEGAELDVLLGSTQILQTHRPLLHLSTHEIHRDGVDEKCVRLLKENGYNVQLIASKMEGLIKDYFCKPLSGKV